MEKQARYHTTPYCSRPLYGYRLEAGDVLQPGDRYGGDLMGRHVDDWELCCESGHGHELPDLTEDGDIWIRPCEEPHEQPAVPASSEAARAPLLMLTTERQIWIAVYAATIAADEYTQPHTAMFAANTAIRRLREDCAPGVCEATTRERPSWLDVNLPCEAGS